MNYQHLKENFLNRSIASKLKYIYTAFLVICFLCNIFISHAFYVREIQKAITGLTTQTIETVSRNVNNSLQSIAKSSTYLLGTTDVQNYLRGDNKSDLVILSRSLRNSLYLSLESMPLVSSILIVNNSGLYEGAARYALPSITTDTPEKAAWYEMIRQKKGALVYTINGDGYLTFPDGKNYISLIRLVNSTEDARPLGYMIINISADSLFSFARENNSSYSDFCVYSDKEQILPFLNNDLTLWFQSQYSEPLSGENVIKTADHRYLLLKFQSPAYGWNYLGAVNYNRFTDQHKASYTIFIITTIIIICTFLLLAICINHLITSPLRQLMYAMNKTESGDFKHASVTPYADEIGQLQDAFNDMVDKIQSLLETKIAEQKQLRNAELNVLQEQIKPHFLYNSLSAISYLVTSGQNERAYGLLISLSEYYRESLSKGNRIIPLSTEINIVKNYLNLQKVRFPDIFCDEYDIQEQTLSFEVPRLILQPLVENALYHGIIPTGDYGTIKIQIFTDEQNLVIKVCDNGIGIPPETLQNIMATQLEINEQSFGLRGTIERMQIFYETQNIYEISSSKGEGTDITFSIPLNKVTTSKNTDT